MKAIGYLQPGDLARADALVDIEVERPHPKRRDLLVKIDAVSVNPVDIKIRKGTAPEPGAWKILGWDASGTVAEVGAEVTGFAVGDQVYYAGALNRQGTHGEFHLVDERIVARRPKTLSAAAAAALPLTSLTAWEMLFDRLEIAKPVPGAANAILIIGGAGGVGSIAIQLVRALTDLTVVATASRPETAEWVRKLGAHHVIDHSLSLSDQVSSLEIGAPGFVFSTTKTDLHLQEIASLIAPQGRFGLIDDPDALDLKIFKRKSVSIHWEFMFTRSAFMTPDIGEQGRILAEVARLADAGEVQSTVTEVLRPINAETMKTAQAKVESGNTMGKIVLESFEQQPIE